jgi:hypothetical protein
VGLTPVAPAFGTAQFCAVPVLFLDGLEVRCEAAARLDRDDRALVLPDARTLGRALNPVLSVDAIRPLADPTRDLDDEVDRRRFGDGWGREGELELTRGCEEVRCAAGGTGWVSLRRPPCWSASCRTRLHRSKASSLRVSEASVDTAFEPYRSALCTDTDAYVRRLAQTTFGVSADWHYPEG